MKNKKIKTGKKKKKKKKKREKNAWKLRSWTD